MGILVPMETFHRGTLEHAVCGVHKGSRMLALMKPFEPLKAELESLKTIWKTCNYNDSAITLTAIATRQGLLAGPRCELPPPDRGRRATPRARLYIRNHIGILSLIVV